MPGLKAALVFLKMCPKPVPSWTLQSLVLFPLKWQNLTAVFLPISAIFLLLLEVGFGLVNRVPSRLRIICRSESNIKILTFSYHLSNSVSSAESLGKYSMQDFTVLLLACFDDPQFFYTKTPTKKSPSSPLLKVEGTMLYLPGERCILLVTSLRLMYWFVFSAVSFDFPPGTLDKTYYQLSQCFYILLLCKPETQ